MSKLPGSNNSNNSNVKGHQSQITVPFAGFLMFCLTLFYLSVNLLAWQVYKQEIVWWLMPAPSTFIAVTLILYLVSVFFINMFKVK